VRLRRQREGSARFLTTILFVDIVGSTELASAIGDAAWQILLGRYYAAVRDRLKRFGGRQIDTAGDGLFAAFDAPAEAITCALAIRDAATEPGAPMSSVVFALIAQAIRGRRADQRGAGITSFPRQ
jgi:class 3 adenylate cyclase